jgi:hypothetical protein
MTPIGAQLTRTLLRPLVLQRPCPRFTMGFQGFPLSSRRIFHSMPQFPAASFSKPCSMAAQGRKVIFRALSTQADESNKAKKETKEITNHVKFLLSKNVTLSFLLQYFEKEILDPSVLLHLFSEEETRNKLISLALSNPDNKLQKKIFEIVKWSPFKMLVAQEMIKQIVEHLISPRARNEVWDKGYQQRYFEEYSSLLSQWIKFGRLSKEKDKFIDEILRLGIVANLFENKKYSTFRELASKEDFPDVVKEIFLLLMETKTVSVFVALYQKCVREILDHNEREFFLRALSQIKDEHEEWPNVCAHLSSTFSPGSNFSPESKFRETAFASKNPIYAEIMAYSHWPLPKFLEGSWPGKFIKLMKDNNIGGCQPYDIAKITWSFYLGVGFDQRLVDLLNEEISEEQWISYFNSIEDGNERKKVMSFMWDHLGRGKEGDVAKKLETAIVQMKTPKVQDAIFLSQTGC